MAKKYSDLVEYLAEVESSIKELLETYGISKSIKNQNDIMENIKFDLAFEKFVPMEGRITASMVGYEMDLEPSDVSIFISFFFAFQRIDKNPKGLSAFFSKKKETDIDNEKIVQMTQDYVLDSKDLFEEFMGNLNNKIEKK